RWTEAAGLLDDRVRELAGGGVEEILRLTDTELFARLSHGEATAMVRDKTLWLAALLHEAGAVAAGQGRDGASRDWFLEGLHLLLGGLDFQEAVMCPDFVPRVDRFVEALRGEPLPLTTEARLMRHYEQTGQFGKAEDALFNILEAQPGSAEALDFGIVFC